MAETKYPTSLTGQQIDQALADMAARNSEAYAVGRRNEQDVPPGDVTYHNNAKYYSDRAGSSAQQASQSASSASQDAADAALSEENAHAAAIAAQSCTEGRVMLTDEHDSQVYYIGFYISQDGYPTIRGTEAE